MVTVKGLEIVAIRDEGTMEERVLFKANTVMKLDNFVVINAKSAQGTKVTLLNEHVYWFQDGVTVNAGEIVRLYTRKTGVYNSHVSKYGEEDVRFHDFHWGLTKPVWDMTHSDAVMLLSVETWGWMKK